MARCRQRNTSPLVTAQRSHFLEEEAEFFVIAMARPLALSERTNSSVSIGFLLDHEFRERVRFWDDPAVPRLDVNLTCERCRLSSNECHERAAAPRLYEKQVEQGRKEEALGRLLEELAVRERSESLGAGGRLTTGEARTPED
jgi:XRE family transcriptional regulator, fatty acid utilization regulator